MNGEVRLVRWAGGSCLCAAVILFSVGGAVACGARTAIGFVQVGSAVEAGSTDGEGGSSADSGCEPPSCAPGGPGMTNCGAAARAAARAWR